MTASKTAQINVHSILENRQLMRLKKAEPTTIADDFTQVHIESSDEENIGIMVALILGFIINMVIIILGIRQMA